MKNCTLLSLLCVFVTHITLAKVGMPCDNTLVLKYQKFLPLTKKTTKSASLLNPLSQQHFSAPTAAMALTSTMVLKEEIEPNNDILLANPLGGNDVKIKGYITPVSDVDIFSFSANAGDKVFVATQTALSISSTSTSLEILPVSGSGIELDESDGSFGSLSSSIAGAVIPSTGTYYIRVKHISNTNTVLPYYMYFRLQQGSSTAEVEPNNDSDTANPLPNSGWVNGSLSSGEEADYYSITLGAGDTIFLSLDFNPERDQTTWNGQIAFGEFETTGGTIQGYLPVNDLNTVSPNSESLFLTVRTAGTYYIAVAPYDGSFGTYQLSASVLPAPSSNITTYSITDNKTIADNPGVTTSTLNIPVNKKITSLKFFMTFFHGKIGDLDVRLTSPSGNTVVLFTNLTNIADASPFEIKLDDIAAIPIQSFSILKNVVYQPPTKYRLDWFKGQMTQGNWTLTIEDDASGGSGQLNSWGLEIEEELPVTGTLTDIYTNDFEINDGGFTHSGGQDEWERGIPTFAPISTANSGTHCWKTDLDNTYNFNTSCELVSPNIYIPDLGSSKAYFSWAQKYQFATTNNVTAYIEIQEVGTLNKKRVWQWFGLLMTENVGNPSTLINESAGWGVTQTDVSEFSNKTIKIIYHFDSDSNNPRLAGWAIDDVRIFKTFCDESHTLSANYTGVFSRVVAGTTITATNEITANIPLQSQANIVYQGGNSITLLPNFKAEATGGAVFTAQIGGCN